jgi:hypothetical protein
MLTFPQTESIIFNFLILYCVLSFVIKIKSHNIEVYVIIFINRLIFSMSESLGPG